MNKIPDKINKFFTKLQADHPEAIIHFNYEIKYDKKKTTRNIRKNK